MNVVWYGPQDADPALEIATVLWATGKCENLVVARHQRRNVHSKPCQKPGALLFEVLLDNSSKAYPIWQLASGEIELPKEYP